MLNQLLEKLKRPGLLGAIGIQREKHCQAQLHTYFKELGRRIAAMDLQQLADPQHTHLAQNIDLAKHSVRLKLANTIRTFTPLLKSVLEINIHDALLAANKIHHFAEADDDLNDDAGGDYGTIKSGFFMTSEEAALYASVRAGELVSGINDTTQKLISDAISEGITDRLGVDGTKRLLLATIKDMAANRARMIASTEMNDAFSEATIRKLKRIDVDYKQWILSVGACPICEENADAGAIPIDDLFPSGDDRPPAHPNCRCAVSGARAPEAAA